MVGRNRKVALSVYNLREQQAGKTMHSKRIRERFVHFRFSGGLTMGCLDGLHVIVFLSLILVSQVSLDMLVLMLYIEWVFHKNGCCGKTAARLLIVCATYMYHTRFQMNLTTVEMFAKMED